MSISYTVSTLLVRGGLWAVSTVSSNVNQVLMFAIYTLWTHFLCVPVVTFLFKVLRNGLFRYILYTCPNLWLRSCSKCYGMDCFGTCSTHVQTCDYVRVQSATEWTASVHALHMSKPVITFVFKVLRNGLQWTASVHSLHLSKQVIAFAFKLYMSKPVITFAFKVLRNGLLRYIVYTRPNLWCYTLLTFLCHSCVWSHALTVTSCVICFCVYAWLMLRHVDFSLSFMFEITRSHCYVMSHLLVCVCMVQQFKWKSMEKFQKTKITCKKFWNQRCLKC